MSEQTQPELNLNVNPPIIESVNNRNRLNHEGKVQASGIFDKLVRDNGGNLAKVKQIIDERSQQYRDNDEKSEDDRLLLASLRGKVNYYARIIFINVVSDEKQKDLDREKNWTWLPGKKEKYQEKLEKLQEEKHRIERPKNFKDIYDAVKENQDQYELWGIVGSEKVSHEVDEFFDIKARELKSDTTRRLSRLGLEIKRKNKKRISPAVAIIHGLVIGALTSGAMAYAEFKKKFNGNIRESQAKTTEVIKAPIKSQVKVNQDTSHPSIPTYENWIGHVDQQPQIGKLSTSSENNLSQENAQIARPITSEAGDWDNISNSEIITYHDLSIMPEYIQGGKTTNVENNILPKVTEYYFASGSEKKFLPIFTSPETTKEPTLYASGDAHLLITEISNITREIKLNGNNYEIKESWGKIIGPNGEVLFIPIDHFVPNEDNLDLTREINVKEYQSSKGTLNSNGELILAEAVTNGNWGIEKLRVLYIAANLINQKTIPPGGQVSLISLTGGIDDRFPIGNINNGKEGLGRAPGGGACAANTAIARALENSGFTLDNSTAAPHVHISYDANEYSFGDSPAGDDFKIWGNTAGSFTNTLGASVKVVAELDISEANSSFTVQIVPVDPLQGQDLLKKTQSIAINGPFVDPRYLDYDQNYSHNYFYKYINTETGEATIVRAVNYQ